MSIVKPLHDYSAEDRLHKYNELSINIIFSYIYLFMVYKYQNRIIIIYLKYEETC
jgi:hypothetical protein